MATLINRKNWIVFDSVDIGPLMYKGRYNGSVDAFYFDKKTNKLLVKNRSIYNTPYAYVLHDNTKKHMHYGKFYKFRCDNKDYYCHVNDAIKYLPEELPVQYVVCNLDAIDNKEDADVVIQNFIYKLDTNSSTIKCVSDGNLNNFDSITTLYLVDVLTNTRLITIERINTNDKKTFIFLVDLNIDREEFRYKRDIVTVEDFKKALNSTIAALNEYPTFVSIAEDLKSYL